MKKYKISMKGLTVTVEAGNVQNAQELAQEQAEKKHKDKTVLWVEPEGETKIYYCSVCNIKPVDLKSKSDTCYDCSVDKHK